MEKQMLRACLDKLEKEYGMLTCNVPVDPKFELGAVQEKVGNHQPILFKNVKGSSVPIISGMFGNRDMFYDFTGTTREGRIQKYLDGIANPIPPKVLQTGPVKENIIKKNIDIGKILPLPTFHEHDSSSFITAGVLVVKDPDTGVTATSIRRMQYNGGNNLSVLVTSPYLSGQMKELFAQKKDLECALVIGYDYYYCLASQLSSAQYGLDKHWYDGGLRGEPLEVVKCETVNLEVPAYAEMVIEGVIPYNEDAVEGPFGELMGYYGEVKKHPVMKITAVTHRNNPIFQISAPCKEEHLSNGLIRDVETYANISRFVSVNDVNITIGGGGRFHAIVSINKKGPGDAKTALLAAFGATKDLKHCVIVDDDIDIFNADDVEGALAARVQASKDVFIVPGAMGTGLDPSHLLEGTTDKVGIDATKPLGEEAIKFEKARIPGYENVNLDKFFPNMKLGGRR